MGKTQLKFGMGKLDTPKPAVVGVQDMAPAALFGAMLRMPTLSDGFNIKLGIPSLPQLKDIEDEPGLMMPTYLQKTVEAVDAVTQSPERRRVQKL